MDGFKSIRKAIKESASEPPEKLVEVETGELRWLAGVIHDQSLNLERELRKISSRGADVLEVQQVEFRLKELYKQLTGEKIERAEKNGT